MDTAGLRKSADAIEVAGMQRAGSAMAEADIIAVVTDSLSAFPEPANSAWIKRGPHATGTRQPTTQDSSYLSGASAGDAMQSLKELLAFCNMSQELDNAQLGRLLGEKGTSQLEQDAGLDRRQQPARLLIIRNKRDLWSPSENTAGPQGKARPPHSDASSQDGHVRSTAAGGHMSAGAAEGTPPTCSVSCKTGEGIKELLSMLGSLIRQVAGSGECDNDSALITRCGDFTPNG